MSRLAPSPTGALHLGNARTFLINWAIARQRGWRLVLRIEDLDGPRVKVEAVDQSVDILRWLGMDWDGPILQQSHDLSDYEDAIHRLADLGLIYQCNLTRREIEAAASAPHNDTGELRYPPELRPSDHAGYAFAARETNYRLLVEPERIEIDDAVVGPTSSCPAEEVGDFVVWTRRGGPSYQLAVVVDDIRQGVTDVIRGDDLLSSAGRQMLLYRALGAEPPRWWHLPLVVGPDGRRLAKRHGDSRISSYRAAGVPAERIIALLGRWSGIEDVGERMTADEFARRFDPDTLPVGSVTMSEDDHTWLLNSSPR